MGSINLLWTGHVTQHMQRIRYPWYQGGRVEAFVTLTTDIPRILGVSVVKVTTPRILKFGRWTDHMAADKQ